MHIAAVGTKIDDGVSDDLAGSVICHVAAPAGLVHRDAKLGEAGMARDDVRPAAVAFHPQRDDGRMLQEQEQIGDMPGAPFLDEAALHRKRLVIRHDAESTDFKLANE
jgi:hypothetical protein